MAISSRTAKQLVQAAELAEEAADLLRRAARSLAEGRPAGAAWNARHGAFFAEKAAQFAAGYESA